MTDSRDMTNADIDRAIGSLPSVTSLTATCAIDIADDIIPLPAALLQHTGGTLILPLWFRHHWILGSMRGDTIDIWDSAPSGHVKADVVAFTKHMATRLGRPLRVRGRLAARQPYGTRQCGIHAIVRALLSSLGISALIPNIPVVDWEELRTVLPSRRKNDPALFITAALVAATRPADATAAAHDRVISHLRDDDVQTTFRAGQVNHRFLIAKHAGSNTKPSQWSWGIATITKQKRAGTIVDWTPLLDGTSATTLSFPSASDNIFALAPLRPAPITWEVSTTDVVEPSLAPTLRVGELSPDATPSPSRTPAARPSRVATPAAHTPVVRATDPSAINRPVTTILRDRAAPVQPIAVNPVATPHTRLNSYSPDWVPHRETSPSPRMPATTTNRTEEGTSTLIPAAVLQAASQFPRQSGSSLKGRDVVDLQVLEVSDANVPPLALRALAPATAANHRQLLRSMSNLPRNLHDVSLDKALVEWQCRLQKSNNWLFSTLHTRLASIAGALKLLPLYVNNRPSIHMASSVVWSQASAAAANRARLRLPHRATPANWSDVTDILTRENHSIPSIAILLAWLTCGRMADVLRLKSLDIGPGSEYLTVTFRDTKTRNPYTVATALPPAPHLQPLLDAIETANVNRPIFKTSAPAVARLLKAQRAGLSQHSLRRGGLQTLAAAGLPTTAIIHFSGHKSVTSLLAYLDDGAVAPENPARAIQARILIGGGVDTDYTPLPPPSLHEIRACFPGKALPRPPLHMKKVEHMDLDALLLLPMQEDTRSYLRTALRWVRDPTLFEEALARGLPVRRKHKPPGFTDKELETMENYKFATAAEKGASFPVYGFPVRQHKSGKEVLRPIWEPTINDAVDNFQGQELHLPTRERVLRNSTPGSKAPHIWCQLDAVSCFDQVPLHPSVRKYFTFFWDGSLKALLSLPMGFRRAVEVSCAILWALLDFPRPAEVRVDSYVDNARFSGPTDAAADAVITFVKRAAAVGYQIDRMPKSRSEVIKASPLVDTFLGVKYDYKQQTRSISEKTIGKLKAIGLPPPKMTHRQLACIVGLATWSGTILNFAWHKVWHLLRRYASCAVAWNPTLSIVLSKKEHDEMKVLLCTCATNMPVPILATTPPPVDVVLITDASKTGWGALAGKPGGHPTTLSGQWAQFIGSSVVAEPEGAWQALQAMQLTHKPQHVRILTDHLPLVYASESGRATAWSYNSLLSRLATLPFHVSLEFLPGIDNPADAPSRGVALSSRDIEAFRRHVPTEATTTTAQRPRFMT